MASPEVGSPDAGAWLIAQNQGCSSLLLAYYSPTHRRLTAWLDFRGNSTRLLGSLGSEGGKLHKVPASHHPKGQASLLSSFGDLAKALMWPVGVCTATLAKTIPDDLALSWITLSISAL